MMYQAHTEPLDKGSISVHQIFPVSLLAVDQVPIIANPPDITVGEELQSVLTGFIHFCLLGPRSTHA
jgi:hypothetical protein